MANRKIKIRYIKSYDFKISLATGVYGGIATNGLINVNFFNERAVLPDSQTIEIDENGKTIGKEIDERDGDITRELQSGILIDINAAKVVINWLQGKIDEHEKVFPRK
jgi:hypothetical protein